MATSALALLQPIFAARAPVQAALLPRAGSSFSLDPSQPSLTFNYVSDRPALKNWIGIYRASGGGPDNQQQNEDSLTWAYASWDQGSVHIDLRDLSPGDYKAYFLADDGYTWLASPIPVRVNFNGRQVGSKVVFEYVTSSPASKNWVGVYPISGGGPDAQKQVDNSLVWNYASDATGSVSVNVNSLPAGSYKAYFLQNDGYRWAAPPVFVDVMGNSGSSISASLDGGSISVNYQTPTAGDKNWIGIYYAHNGGPVGEKLNAASLTWDWASSTSGTVKLSTNGLPRGLHYQIFLLKDGGYTWLAKPITFFLPGSGNLEFVVGNFETARAQVNTAFSSRINSLLKPYSTDNIHFEKTDGPDWVSVSTDGIVTGVPSSDDNASVKVQAKAPDGSTANLNVQIPVASSRSKVVDELRVLSFNMWFGGTQVNDYHNKQVSFLASEGLDIVGLQESGGNHANRLAEALGWYSWQGSDVGIISRYPIAEVYPTVFAAGGVRIKLDKTHEVNFWNAHPTAYPYGPYGVCFDHGDANHVNDIENRSGRPDQMREIVSAMKTAISNADSVPVILTGDMNAPSHLDWVESTRDSHCQITFQWPTSVLPIQAGLRDSFRDINPDPAAVPGNTWSPIYLTNSDYKGQAEPLDRIDFIYYKGLDVLDSHTVVKGNPTAEPNHQNNEWTTDHAAVRSVFRLKH